MTIPAISLLSGVRTGATSLILSGIWYGALSG